MCDLRFLPGCVVQAGDLKKFQNPVLKKASSKNTSLQRRIKRGVKTKHEMIVNN